MESSTHLGILWPWVLVRGGSPLLQAIASNTERGAATLGKTFVSLNMLFAEPYLASASQLHSRGVSELTRCDQSVTLEQPRQGRQRQEKMHL